MPHDDDDDDEIANIHLSCVSKPSLGLLNFDHFSCDSFFRARLQCLPTVDTAVY